MTDPTAPGRFGRDGLNEHVHSYYITILARGGIVQLMFMMFYYFNIYNNLKISSNRKILLMYLLPIAMHVSFDISMEGVQFPMVFLTFIGYLYTKLKLTEKTI
jgi:O-antigen ligase